MLCKNCMNEIPDGSAVCPSCAAPVMAQPDLTQPDLTQSDLTQSDLTQPDLTQSDLTKAEPTQPEPTQPDASDPIFAASPEATIAADAPVSDGLVNVEQAQPEQAQPEQAQLAAQPEQAIPTLPVASTTVPAQEPKTKKGTKILIGVLIGLVVLMGIFAVLCALDVIDFKKVSEEIIKPKTYSVVGDWEFVYGDKAQTILTIDEDFDVTVSGGDAGLGGFGKTEYTYNEEDKAIDMKMTILGFSNTVSMPCELCEDFLIVSVPDMLSGLGMKLDPITLRRVGTDGDPVAFYKEKFGVEEYTWDPANSNALSSIFGGLGSLFGGSSTTPADEDEDDDDEASGGLGGFGDFGDFGGFGDFGDFGDFFGGLPSDFGDAESVEGDGLTTAR